MVERKFGLGVFVCIFNQDFSKVLLLKRNEEKRKRYDADWGNVGGRIELGEMSIDACIREAREEIGLELSPEKIKRVDVKETPYMSKLSHAVHFVYATHFEEDKEVKINDESDEYCWFYLEDLPERMIDDKEYIKEILKKYKESLD
jgi:8-oxo-dGTP diphosphatase